MVGSLCVKAQTDKSKWAHRFSLSVSPWEMVEPIVRVQAEMRAGNKSGIGFQAAIGNERTQPVWCVGVQYAYYLIGNFEHGMQVGGLFQYGHSKTLARTDAEGKGIIFGPILGYKYVAPFDLTVGVTAGSMILRHSTQHNTGYNQMVSSTSTAFGLYAVLWLGWTL